LLVVKLREREREREREWGEAGRERVVGGGRERMVDVSKIAAESRKFAN
jgi:hypothetical protein